MRFPIYQAVLILLLGAAVGSVSTYFIATREKTISPDKGQLLAKCELEARGKYNRKDGDWGEFDEVSHFIKLCMRTYNYQFDDHNYECDAIKRENSDLIKFKKEYQAAKTEAEKRDINIRTGKVVEAMQSIQATTPACYEYVRVRT
jgi:hypothetical protein